MSIDSVEFRAALGSLAAGVSVITAISKRESVGITVSSFTSLSLHPALILFCLDRKSSHCSAFNPRKKFAVNLLTQEQKHLAELFAGQQKKIWDQVPHEENKHAVRILKNTLAALHCTVTKTHKSGDHLIIIGKIDMLGSINKEARPLLYFRRHYHGLGAIVG
ncbi:MAG: flavin reductase [Alphaproteobacteria bacterium]|nr:flavin reductase [Alphaproteobacteria bacterium]